jgi:hypothetical protein
VARSLSGSAKFGAARSSTTTTRALSTSAARLSGAPAMSSQAREYDPEIKDIADYVANKPIDSDLAVSAILFETLGVGDAANRNYPAKFGEASLPRHMKISNTNLLYYNKNEEDDS